LHRAALRHQGVGVNSRKLPRLMREHGLQPKWRRCCVVTTDSDHDGPIFPNLSSDIRNPSRGDTENPATSATVTPRRMPVLVLP